MTLVIVLAGLRRIYPKDGHGQIAAAVKLSQMSDIRYRAGSLSKPYNAVIPRDL
jgi:hypothetical protein